jgi:hypothetical protein
MKVIVVATTTIRKVALHWRRRFSFLTTVPPLATLTARYGQPTVAVRVNIANA